MSEPAAWAIKIAEFLYDRREEIDGLAMNAGQVEQSMEAERWAWCREVAKYIEPFLNNEHTRLALAAITLVRATKDSEHLGTIKARQKAIRVIADQGFTNPLRENSPESVDTNPPQ